MNGEYSTDTFYSRLCVLTLTGLLALSLCAIWFQPVPVKAQPDDVNAEIIRFSENFDTLTVPELPAAWTTSRTGQNALFISSNINPDSAPNSIFTNEPLTAGSSEITSPDILLGDVPARLTFRHIYQTEAGVVGGDGGVLEISIAGGAFQDILTAGGNFVTGGYVQTIGSGSNPLVGRFAWTGNSNGYLLTTVNLPLSAENQNIKLRWRFGSDASLAGLGWRLDNIQVVDSPPAPLTGFIENFDSVTAPALPAGWTIATSGAQNSSFATQTSMPDTPANAVFTNDPASVGTSDLVSPPIRIGRSSAKLIFRHLYNSQLDFDGGVLEIKIGDSFFQDITNAGGTFVSGAYNRPISTQTLSPIAGRAAWTGFSNGYVTTEINLPPSVVRQTIQFRWRFATDNQGSGSGWWIDTVQVVGAAAENSAAISIPEFGSSAPYPSEINVANQVGQVSNVIVFLNNFSHASPDDVDLMLVAPNGRKVVLMSDVGGANPVSNLSLAFDDFAAESLPDITFLSSGIYKPTNFEPGDTFPSPAPSDAPTGSMLSAFNGTNPNGVWKLFLVDDAGNNAGSISGGWSIAIQTSQDVVNIPLSGAAEPYPSDKLISGLPGHVSKATVTISNFSHTSPDDVDIMLAAPDGRRIVLMSDVGGNAEVGALDLTFDDAAAGNLPDNAPLTSGVYKPTDFEPGDAFPAPAPPGVSGTTLNAFFGSVPNGVWKLYVVDDNGNNLGSIAGGWSLNLQTSVNTCLFSVSPTVQAFPITGGSGSFAINMPAGCSWSASTGSNFININSSAGGSGNGTINFSIAPNMSGGRTGTIDVSNGVTVRSFQIQQPSGCPFSLNQTTVNFGGAGGNGNVSVTAGSVCSWQATSGANWIQITSAMQTGDGAATFSVQPNPTANTRSATVTVGARSFTVNQAGAPGRKFDFDGDRKADISVFRPSEGNWYTLGSQSNSLIGVHFGQNGDKLTPADYDGDGKTDFAVYRSGTWFVFNSQSSTIRIDNWGLDGDIPIPADYDGEGRADLAIYRPAESKWYILRSSNGAFRILEFGNPNDKPVPADYDGDGQTDVAVYRAGASAGAQSFWFIQQSSDNSLVQRQFGNGGDIAVTGDFDGDGRDNTAVYRPSNRTWYTSLDPNTNYGAQQFGIATDVPVPADYDGDGKTDIAVFRIGRWFILNSGSGTVRIEDWGLSTDKAVPAAYVF
ncbi:MAG TPA: proprotein convertase P-domain-containing protein [Pyrinomonadaceae bacterium]|jgi:subtilisin-like proprotein convertase family protein